MWRKCIELAYNCFCWNKSQSDKHGHTNMGHKHEKHHSLTLTGYSATLAVSAQMETLFVVYCCSYMIGNFLLEGCLCYAVYKWFW